MAMARRGVNETTVPQTKEVTLYGGYYHREKYTVKEFQCDVQIPIHPSMDFYPAGNYPVPLEDGEIAVYVKNFFKLPNGKKMEAWLNSEIAIDDFLSNIIQDYFR